MLLNMWNVKAVGVIGIYDIFPFFKEQRYTFLFKNICLQIGLIIYLVLS